MKFFLLIVPFISLVLCKENCKNKTRNSRVAATGCYKGKLEVKGGCMNYTISITSQNFDTALVMTNWKDESTGKNYKNVFATQGKYIFIILPSAFIFSICHHQGSIHI